MRVLINQDNEFHTRDPPKNPHCNQDVGEQSGLQEDVFLDVSPLDKGAVLVAQVRLVETFS